MHPEDVKRHLNTSTPMNTKLLLSVLSFCLSGFATLFAGTVQTTISPPTPVSACFDVLDVTLTITGMSPSSGNCDITFQGVPGSVITLDSATGDFVSTDVIVNSPQLATVTNPSGSSKTGTIHFKLALTGCELYNLPLDGNNLRHIQFTTAYPCGSPPSSDVSLEVNLPTLQIVTSPFGQPSHNDEPFLLNQVVQRFYAIEVPSGIVDFFTFDIQPEPGIEIQSVDAVDTSSTLKLSLSTGPATSLIHLVFGAANIPIASCSFGASPFLKAGTSDYILIRETIKITACSSTGDPNTVYTAAVHCDGNINSTPCWIDAKQLNVNCEQRSGPRTGLNVYISDNTAFNSVGLNTYGVYGATPTFPSISVCPNGAMIDYVIFLDNYADPDISVPPLPVGAGARQLDVVTIPINGDYFTYDDIKIGNTTLTSGTHYTRTGIGTAYDVATINLATLTADPDGAGGLTDVIGSLGVAGRFNLLKEGEHVTIVLKNFRLIGQSKFTQCAQPPYNITLNGTYLTVSHRSMCQMNDVIGPAAQLYDFIWRMRNLFSGFAFASSDVTDIAPGRAGQPQSANLRYKFTTIGPAQANPFSISQRPDYLTPIPELVNCPNLKYYAALTLPPGFTITGNHVIITDPAPSSPFLPTIVVATGTDPNKVIDYTGVTDSNGNHLQNPAQAELTFNVTIDCAAVKPLLFGSAFFPLEFRAACDNACPEVYRVMACATVEVFFHCFGECTPAPPVGTSNFNFDRITPGWPDELTFATGGLPLPAVDPAYAAQVYECHEILATSTAGYAKQVTQPGIVAFEIAYDPPLGGNNPQLANLFEPETGPTDVQFTFNPRNGTPGPSFSVPMLSSQGSDFKVLAGRDALRVYADMNTPVGLTTAAQLLSVGDYEAVFSGRFRVRDANTPQPQGLAPGFYNIQQIRGQFIVVDNTAQHNVVDHSCDPWGDQQTFLKTSSGLERNGFISPSYNVQYDNLFPVDQCYLRYVVIASTIGGFAAGVDFPTEYMPTLTFPDEISINIPSGYEFVRADYAEGPQALGPWQQFITGVVGGSGSVSIHNIHASYPDRTSIEKAGGSARQAILITLRRDCPLLQDSPITVGNLDIETRAYSPAALCHEALMPTQPQQIIYSPGAEVYDIAMTTVPLTIGNVNPVTIPVSLNHNGSGTGV